MPTPQYHPLPRELDDLELLASGALHPVTRFNEPGSPITLTLPDALADESRWSSSTRRACRSPWSPPTGPSPRSPTPSTGRSAAST